MCMTVLAANVQDLKAAGTGSRWGVADGVAKGLLAVLLLFALTHSDWDRFSDKAMIARAVAYPLLIAIVPAVWYVRAVRARRAGRVAAAYPGLVGLLVTMPFVIDVGGNALDLYDRIDVFDDVCHFGNWALLCSAVGVALLSRPDALPGWVVGSLCVGFGATTAVLWEIAEYGAFVTHTPERYTLYRDTMGDLTLGLAGSIAAGLACGVAARRANSRQRDLETIPNAP
jgi:drug/metabolite transporter superfamily protein YnfA